MGSILQKLLPRMSVRHSTAPVASLPPGFSKDEAQLNDSVWQLYSPDRIPEVDIIFFHGLQVDNFEDAFWKTWLARDDDQVIWPKDWLSRKLPNARILSVSYNSSATQSIGQNEMYTLGENLVQDIILDTEWDIGQMCPVFLVGHCLGGIVIKQFILSASVKMNLINPLKDQRGIERINTFLENFKGAFYYATPHGGSEEIEKFAKLLQNKSPILELLKRLNTHTARINNEFRQQRDKWNARTFGVAESLSTTSLGFNGVVVVEGSARHDVDGHYTHATADHFTVCQARDWRDSTVIGHLIQFISGALPTETTTQKRETYSRSKLRPGI